MNRSGLLPQLKISGVNNYSEAVETRQFDSVIERNYLQGDPRSSSKACGDLSSIRSKTRESYSKTPYHKILAQRKHNNSLDSMKKRNFEINSKSQKAKTDIHLSSIFTSICSSVSEKERVSIAKKKYLGRAALPPVSTSYDGGASFIKYMAFLRKEDQMYLEPAKSGERTVRQMFRSPQKSSEQSWDEEDHVKNSMSFCQVAYNDITQRITIIKDNTAYGLQTTTFQLREIANRFLDAWTDFKQLDNVQYVGDEILKILHDNNYFRPYLSNLDNENKALQMNLQHLSSVFGIELKNEKDVFFKLFLKKSTIAVKNIESKRKGLKQRRLGMLDNIYAQKSEKRPFQKNNAQRSKKQLIKMIEDLLELMLILEKVVLTQREEYLTMLKAEFTHIQGNQNMQRLQLKQQFNEVVWKDPEMLNSYLPLMDKLKKSRIFNVNPQKNIFDAITKFEEKHGILDSIKSKDRFNSMITNNALQ